MSFTFEPVPEKPDIPREELNTLEYWDEIDAFRESLRQSEGKKPYVFYDGPPFATGLPHYGHILAGTIKDVMCRYFHQNGYHVERRFGWDCHGLPVEHEIDKKLSIKGRQDVLDMGIDKYNEECRSIVQRFTSEWRKVVTRFGRWIDFDNDYKTMDLSFMESVWWVFKQLFDKGMVYRAMRVMPFSTALSSPLSNFEVALNYKEVSDPSIIVQFRLKEKEDHWFLAWTTTPWTLPSNVALCVNPELTYLKVKKKADGHVWILGKDRWAWICSSIKKKADTDFEVLEEVKGESLVGTPYLPLFDYFKGKVLDKAWHVVSDKYVTTDAGTCIVHQAPAFGEDDNRVCLKFGIIHKDGTGLVCPVDSGGCYTDEVSDFKGQHVKEADKPIKEMLKQKGNMVFNGMETHNYPHCYRSDTPLIYKAVPSWFVKVEEAREQLIANNNKTYWVPAFVKEKRFHNWLAEARDWCVSRNRYWGTPIPIWVSDDFEEMVCVGSVAELEKYAGRKVTDIHRHLIDDIQIPSQKGKGMLKRVDEVLDCWFESGSMPYASRHYPFENKDSFEQGFPAQFIAEGLDQTRGWFYTLMVLSTHLFDKPAFQNLIVNGLVLAADGKKMSKRLKNYPDPQDIVKNYGADAVRMYMCNSPVVRAEPLKFTEMGVRDVVKDVLLKWYNSYRWLVLEVSRFESHSGKFVPDPERIKASSNLMDKWINAGLHDLIKFVRQEMEAYRLYTVVPRLVAYLEDLTNMYIRLNRPRMKGDYGVDEQLTSLCTLYEVLLNTSILLAPVTPFMTELIYRNLARALPEGHPKKCKSVHFTMIPDFDPEALDDDIVQAVRRMRSVVELGRVCRERRKVLQKMPVLSMVITNKNESYVKDLKTLQGYIQDELNVEEISYSTESKATLSATLNFKELGKKLGKNMKAVQAAVKELSQEDLTKFEAEGKLEICGHEILAHEMQVSRRIKDLDNPNLDTNADAESLVVIDFTYDEDLCLKGLCREVKSRINGLLKDAKLETSSAVDIWAEALGEGLMKRTLTQKGGEINKMMTRQMADASLLQGHEVVVATETYEVNTNYVDEKKVLEKLKITITTSAPHFNAAALKKLTGGDAKADLIVRQFVQSFSLQKLVDAQSKPLKIEYDGKTFEVKYHEHWAWGAVDAPWLKK
mmetsp:Transcript_128641/g.222982  ORF Transcript_128641/g.222982 Transcript_128641/m.222982 type:complete len:1155 (-) Transcript_128641:133-3597(-)